MHNQGVVEEDLEQGQSLLGAWRTWAGSEVQGITETGRGTIIGTPAASEMGRNLPE